MKQSEEYRSRHSMEVPGKSTEVPGGCTEVPDNCQELPWSRKKSLYGCHENAAWQQLTDKISYSHFLTTHFRHDDMKRPCQLAGLLCIYHTEGIRRERYS